ncbi:viperin family antiviral radical SAM protein [Acinetobacter pollinis]|uniref:viperin family antiviral radical SAM protein n=1 Tax=Acinetobacter pollinis TaxID=2605270 RepID=UPI0018A2DA76|nr:viperin family antiviral radical SAM protein [Acinetobacter pollinis]MBF7691285.1 radical SAM protein [Acinetobacter pollinis]MBF7698685.1 radical SAM protein [Acinetobacter pollinis]
MKIVINYHLTEACNYKCFYCFAKWQNKNQKEVLHSKEKIHQLMFEISLLPTLLNAKYGTNFSGVRLNLVGGETFLYKKQVLNIIEEARKYDFELSAITNGSYLDQDLIRVIATQFSMIGFSVDSINDESNIKIGRSFKNIPIKKDEILKSINEIRSISPNIDIKINSVISQINKDENLTNFIKKASPSKWKIFKMLPIITNQNVIDDYDFDNFLKRHNSLQNIISSENNDEMTHSYLMIDPIGRFFQNSPTSSGYKYSSDIIIRGASNTLEEIIFNPNKFLKRSKLISGINI